MSIKVTVREERSTKAAALQTVLRPFRPALAKPRKFYPEGSPRLRIPSAVKKICDVREREVEGIWIYDFYPIPHQVAVATKAPLEEKKKRRASVLLLNKLHLGEHAPQVEGQTEANLDGPLHRLVMLSGGGWTMTPSPLHWKLAAEIAKQLPRYRLSLVSYPLAPKNTAVETMPKLHAMFTTLARDAAAAGENISLIGDSAGGQLSIMLAVHACQLDEKLPIRNIFAISPSVDLRPHMRPRTESVKNDPLLTWDYEQSMVGMWAGTLDRESPELSPMLADVDALRQRGVQLHGISGTYDILSPDIQMFCERLRKHEVQGEWLEWSRQSHVFPLMFAYGFPESVEAVKWLVDVMERHI